MASGKFFKNLINVNVNCQITMQNKTILHQDFPKTVRKNTKSTVRAGNLGQISSLTLDCGAIGFLRALLQRRDWLILI
jgi:hypothetical protein